MRIVPEESRRVARRVRSRSRWASVRVLEVGMHQVSSMRVLLVLTCCPPGPPARVAWKASSFAGIVS